jgi:zinc protease
MNSMSLAVEVLQSDVDLGLDLLSDILLNATFPEAIIEREKQVQLAGIKAEEEHMSTAARLLLRAKLFAGHPYALNASGSRESVASFTRAQLVTYRDRLIVAHNGVISIFGNVETDAVRAKLESLVARLPAGQSALENPPQPAALSASTTVEQNKPDKEQAVLMIGYQTVDLLHPDKLALNVIDEACGDLGSRFFVRIREELGLAYFVGSTQVEGLAPGALVFYLGTDPAKLTAVRAEFEDEIAALARDGLTPEEFERARKKLLGRQAIAMQSNANVGFRVALDELYGRGHEHYLRLAADLEALTLERINAVARTYLHERPHVVAIVKPA